MGGWAPFKSGYKENKEKKTQEISFDGQFLSISKCNCSVTIIAGIMNRCDFFLKYFFHKFKLNSKYQIYFNTILNEKNFEKRTALVHKIL